MKKFFSLLIGCLILGTAATEAQTGNVRIIDPIKPEKVKKTRPEYGFEQSVDVSFNLGQSQSTVEHKHINYYNDYSILSLKPIATIMANWVGGRRFNNRFFLGGGVGLGFELADVERLTYGYDGEDDSAMMLNIFSQARFYMGKKKLQPFVALSLGCSMDPFDDRDGIYKHSTAFMINPEVGLNYRVEDHLSFYFNLGYAHAFTDGVQLKLGVTF